jgi:membrane-associated phospholipid phosphatase
MTLLIDPPLKADITLLKLLRSRGHTPAREHAIAVFSKSGEHAASWLALGAAGYVVSKPGSRSRKVWGRGFCATAAAYGLNTAVKYRVRRPRPVLDGLPPLTAVVSGMSFPSAHCTTSFAAAAVYGKLLPTPLVYGLAGAYALSRPYLGVHYPSDVVAGATLGTVIGLAASAGL